MWQPFALMYGSLFLFACLWAIILHKDSNKRQMQTEKPNPSVSNEHLQKIREMYTSADEEYKQIAYQWLVNLIGERNANANFFMLHLFDVAWEEEQYTIDENNYWKITFRTYPVYFNKDYRYKVSMFAKFGGIEILNETEDYSRYQVGLGQPKFDFSNNLYSAFEKAGYVFYSDLLIKKNTNNVKG